MEHLVSVWISEGADGRIFHKESVHPRQRTDMPKTLMHSLESAQKPDTRDPSEEEWTIVNRNGVTSFEYLTTGPKKGWIKVVLYQGTPSQITYFFYPKP